MPGPKVSKHNIALQKKKKPTRKKTVLFTSLVSASVFWPVSLKYMSLIQKLSPAAWPVWAPGLTDWLNSIQMWVIAGVTKIKRRLCFQDVFAVAVLRHAAVHCVDQGMLLVKLVK